MNAELATIDGEVIEDEPRAPMTLFGTDDPTAVVERASTVATALASVINERRLFTSIGNKKHVQVEGWTLLGSMLGVFAEVEWSRPLDNGWEARAVARTLNGNVVGAAEAMCTVNEGRWKSADPYAVRSMAQTRAVSKALRLPLGFIMHLAGYSATPAEELVEDQPQGGERSPSSGEHAGSRIARTHPAVQRTAEEQRLLDELLALPGMSTARLSLLADAVGVPKGQRATADQLRAMLAYDQPGPRVPTSAPALDAQPSDKASPSQEDGPGAVSVQAAIPPPGGEPAPQPSLEDVLAMTGGELIPPKPRTPEYMALTAPEKASARAYWQQHPEPQRPDAEQLKAMVES